ncbi:hypothetical protein [Nocardia sp. NPDC050406]|uniref:DUF7691 family protein n=1 Tax=Nocardia sp. NPDC050406 TaxID=3364318 RepID=UPI00379F2E6B
MGHVMQVYLGDKAQLEGVIGSKDEALLSRLLDAAATEDAVDPKIFRAIIDGGPFDEDDADEYTAAMYSICSILGGQSIDSVVFHFRSCPDIADIFYDWAFEDLLPPPEGSGCAIWTKENNAEELAERTADTGTDVNDGGEGDEVDDEIHWMNESLLAGKDLIFFWGV